MPFPAEIVIARYGTSTVEASVKLCQLPGGELSRYDVDGDRRQILINEKLDEFSQHVAFFVHLIRFAEHIMSDGDSLELDADEYRDGLAFQLFTMLSQNGLWAGLSPERARSIFDAMAAKTMSSARRRKPPGPPPKRRSAHSRRGPEKIPQQ